MYRTRRHFKYLLGALLWTSTAVSQSQPKPQKPIRLIKPITVTYHSHWFLLGGLRLAYRPSDALNEYNVLIGQSVLEGCAIQATECEQGWATNIGYRRYLNGWPFTVYGGANLHWLFEGVRGSTGQRPMLDLSIGFNHQTSGRFNWGMGYSFLTLDDDRRGLNMRYGGWFLTEFGASF